MTTRTVVGGLLVLMTVSGTRGAAQLPRLDDLMREKLEYSKEMVEAVVLGNHEAVERLAGLLIEVSDEGVWSSSQEPEYLHYSRDFREVAANLIEQAQENDLDGISLGYVELTLTCVRCHRYISVTRLAD